MTTIKKPDKQLLNRALWAGLAGIYIAPCNLDQISACYQHINCRHQNQLELYGCTHDNRHQQAILKTNAAIKGPQCHF